MTFTGGCQCGAVRFRIDGPLGRASICHCRMCQKAFGAFYAPLVSAARADLTWTHGEPQRFRSSNMAVRGFCKECGTPLTFEPESDQIELAIGAFDAPADIRPMVQFAVDSALPWIDSLAELPERRPWSDPASPVDPEGIVSYQHPDRGTDR